MALVRASLYHRTMSQVPWIGPAPSLRTRVKLLAIATIGLLALAAAERLSHKSYHPPLDWVSAGVIIGGWADVIVRWRRARSNA